MKARLSGWHAEAEDAMLAPKLYGWFSSFAFAFRLLKLGFQWIVSSGVARENPNMCFS